ncbi:amidohydrolase family protein [Ornithinimicrobium pratense]|uniref:Amidohydrolase family protein n=1 Tax=Ornithinimicrobium pratense TaxID=2593973 RepID=A0A5J6V7F4_9MICO|nr:amidohydrolase family protein [Ornithinimicrobium pratense]QFG69487.1 amidohydrolase family protein [Ornithinimicrobium pratense]
MAAKVILDAHVHVWDPDRFRYDWLGAAGLDRPYLPGALEDAAGEVDEWIFVEADAAPASAFDETLWVSSLTWPGLRAIVAGIDLESCDLAARLVRLSAIPLVRGVRHGLQNAPAESFCSPRLRAGLRQVAAAALRFDACVRWPQLPDLVELVRSVPEAVVVLDHAGKPPVDAGLHSDEGRAWARSLTALAAEGVFVKLSGLGAEASSPEVLRRNAPDLLRAAVDAFGPDRCMFGSDSPVSTGERTGVATAEWVTLVRETVGEGAWPLVSREVARMFYGIDG